MRYSLWNLIGSYGSESRIRSRDGYVVLFSPQNKDVCAQ